MTETEPPVCPECAVGKHGSCAGFTIDEDDEIVDCPCLHYEPRTE